MAHEATVTGRKDNIFQISGDSKSNIVITTDINITNIYFKQGYCKAIANTEINFVGDKPAEINYDPSCKSFNVRGLNNVDLGKTV